MDGAQGGRRRREKEIRFISCADTTAGDAAAAVQARNGPDGNPSGDGPRKDEGGLVRGEGLPSSLLATPTTGSTVAARGRTNLTVATNLTAATGTAPAAVADEDDAVGTPTDCRIVTSTDDIFFSSPAGAQDDSSPSPLTRKPAAAAAPADPARQQQQQQQQRRGPNRHYRRRRGYDEHPLRKRQSRRAPQVGINPFASSRRNSLSSNTSLGSASSSVVAAAAPLTQRSPRSASGRVVVAGSGGGGGGGSAEVAHAAGTTVGIAPTAAGEDGGILPVTALLFAAVEREAERAKAGVLSGDRQSSGASGSGGSAQAEGATSTIAVLRPSSSPDHQLRAAQDNFHVRKHMQNMAQVKQSQKQMREFEGVLKRMEDEALQVRRKARRQRAPMMATTRSPAGLDGGMGSANGSNAVVSIQGATTPYASATQDKGEEESDESYHGSADDGDFDDEEDGEGEGRSGAGGDDMGLLFLDDGSGASKKRYTPLSRQQQQHAGGAPGSSLSTAQQQKMLRRQLIVAERFVREHPELEATLRKELMASESRLTAARTVRLPQDSQPPRTRSTGTALPPPSTRSTTAKPSVVEEQLDWIGFGQESSEADTPVEGERDALVPLDATNSSSSGDSGHATQLPSASHSTSHGPVVRRSESSDSLTALLSESLRHLSHEDLLAELLERGNGRSVYGTEGAEELSRARRQRGGGQAYPPPASPPQEPGAVTSPERQPTPAVARKQGDDERGGEAEGSALTKDPLALATSPSALPTPHPARRVTFAAAHDTADAARGASPGTADSRKRNANNSPRTAGPCESQAKPLEEKNRSAAAAAAAASATGKQPRERMTVKKKKKPREALPVVVGVGDRAAAELEKDMLQTRLEEVEAQMAAAKDTHRTCEMLARLRPTREVLLHRDIVGVYNVSDPREWEEKYPRCRDSTRALSASPPTTTTATTATTSSVVLPRITQAAGSGRGRGRGDGSSGATAAMATPAAATGAKRTVSQKRTFANAAETLGRHRREIFAIAYALDEEQRRQYRLLFIEVLQSMSRRQVASATWPAVQAALDHARDILLHEPREHQSFPGFQAIVHEHFTLLQLVQWPVQQMLERLSALFLLSSREYREWLANLYQKLGNSHDYEARFRAVDRTVKGKEVPDEAHVRLVLHACRRLPRVSLLPTPKTGGAGTTPPPGAAAGTSSKQKASSSSSVSSPSLPRPRRQSSVADIDTAVPATLPLSTLGVPPSHSPQPSPPSKNSLPRAAAPPDPCALHTSRPPSHRVSGDGSSRLPDSLPAGTRHGSSRKEGRAGPTVSAPLSTPADADALSPSSNDLLTMRTVPPAASASSEPEYAIRIEVERQRVISSAVPASGAQGGREGGGSESSGNRVAGREAHPKASASASLSAGTQSKNVNFFNQTFKLHLYNASSPIRVFLLRDGQAIAEGSFSVQRYGNGKKVQLWLPLALTRLAATGHGHSNSGRRRTEIKMTVEVM